MIKKNNARVLCVYLRNYDNNLLVIGNNKQNVYTIYYM